MVDTYIQEEYYERMKRISLNLTDGEYLRLVEYVNFRKETEVTSGNAVIRKALGEFLVRRPPMSFGAATPSPARQKSENG